MYPLAPSGNLTPGNTQVLHGEELFKPKKLPFHILHPKPFYKEGDKVCGNVVSFNLQVLGKIVRNPDGGGN